MPEVEQNNDADQSKVEVTKVETAQNLATAAHETAIVAQQAAIAAKETASMAQTAVNDLDAIETTNEQWGGASTAKERHALVSQVAERAVVSAEHAVTKAVNAVIEAETAVVAAKKAVKTSEVNQRSLIMMAAIGLVMLSINLVALTGTIIYLSKTDGIAVKERRAITDALITLQADRITIEDIVMFKKMDGELKNLIDVSEEIRQRQLLSEAKTDTHTLLNSLSPATHPQ
jgi:hypothetical protein